MKKKNAIAMMILCTMATGCAEKQGEPNETTEKEVVPAINLAYMDQSIKPGDDFFRYANKGWLDTHPIPEEYTTFGAFTEIDQQNELLIQDIINEVSADANAEQGSVAQKIRDFYNAGMDTVAINERGYSELLPYFEQVDALTDKSQLGELVGKMHATGFGGFFGAGVGSDPKQADMNIMHVMQGGLSLPDRDDYFDEGSQEMREKYVEHISNMFQLVGIDAETATAKANSILAFETRLAEKSLTRVERRDPDRTYNKFTRVQLSEKTPNFCWDNYFNAVGAPAFDSLNVGMPDFLGNMDEVISSTDIEVIKDYMKWKIITGSASQLSDDFVAENFAFYSNYLYGQEVQQPRWRRILNATDGCLGEAIGQIYVEKHFPAEAKARMENLVANLKTSLGERIKVLDWMDDATKEKALHKLACINVKVGYPNKWKDYSKYEVTADSYTNN